MNLRREASPNSLMPVFLIWKRWLAPSANVRWMALRWISFIAKLLDAVVDRDGDQPDRRRHG
jgi:hypothetical protein